MTIVNREVVFVDKENNIYDEEGRLIDGVSALGVGFAFFLRGEDEGAVLRFADGSVRRVVAKERGAKSEGAGH